MNDQGVLEWAAALPREMIQPPWWLSVAPAIDIDEALLYRERHGEFVELLSKAERKTDAALRLAGEMRAGFAERGGGTFWYVQALQSFTGVYRVFTPAPAAVVCGGGEREVGGF